MVCCQQLNINMYRIIPHNECIMKHTKIMHEPQFPTHSFIGEEAVAKIISLKFADDLKGALEFGDKLRYYGIIQHVTDDHTFKNEKLFYKFITDLSKIPNLETIKYTSVRKNKQKKVHAPRPSRSKEEHDEDSKYNSQLAEIDRVKH